MAQVYTKYSANGITTHAIPCPFVGTNQGYSKFKFKDGSSWTMTDLEKEEK